MHQVDVKALDELVRDRQQREELERQRNLNFGRTLVLLSVDGFRLTSHHIRQGKAPGQSNIDGATTPATEEHLS